MKWKYTALAFLMTWTAAEAGQIQIGPAPDGEPTVVAQKIILENFDPPDCPLVTNATRFGDGSIKALCNNGESYRIFSVLQLGKSVAMKCSALEAAGISGC